MALGPFGCFLKSLYCILTSNISIWFHFMAYIVFVIYSLNPCLCFSLPLKCFITIFTLNLFWRSSSMSSSCLSMIEMVFCSFCRETLISSFVLLWFFCYPCPLSFSFLGFLFRQILSLCCVSPYLWVDFTVPTNYLLAFSLGWGLGTCPGHSGAFSLGLLCCGPAPVSAVRLSLAASLSSGSSQVRSVLSPV